MQPHLKYLDTYKRVHWRAFNVAARLFGLAALIVAIALLWSGIYMTVHPESQSDAELAGFPPMLVYGLSALSSAAIGLAILRVRTYRPDLGDAFLTSKSTGLTSGTKRNWWTGDPKPNMPCKEPVSKRATLD